MTSSLFTDMPAIPEHPILAVRIHAGFNANVFLGGLLSLMGITGGLAGAMLRQHFPALELAADVVRLETRAVHGIAGVSLSMNLPREGHIHRHPCDILAIYEESTLSSEAKAMAAAVWEVLARAEARVHGTRPEMVHFHEVGRMSNILAVGLVAHCLSLIKPAAIAASPLPMTDGEILCAHGIVPYPAPALFSMLDGVAVRPYGGDGEPVTPTGLAILKGLGAKFGAWPKMTVTAAVTAFAPAVFSGTSNGTLFLMGQTLPAVEEA